MREEIQGRYFEDYEVRETIVTPGRTVTDADVVNFAGVSGDFDQLHTNDEYAAEEMFGERIAHGLLGLAFWSGLMHKTQILHGTSMGFLELNVEFERPIHIGDTVYSEMTVAEKHPTSNDDRGIVEFDTDVLNQDEERVFTSEQTFMIKKRP